MELMGRYLSLSREVPWQTVCRASLCFVGRRVAMEIERLTNRPGNQSSIQICVGHRLDVDIGFCWQPL